MLYYAIENRSDAASGVASTDLRAGLRAALDKIGPRARVLLVPPDITRVHSRAGELTRYAWEYYGDSVQAIMPALGTHRAMRDEDIGRMFGNIPRELFRVHNFRRDIATRGEVPPSFIRRVSEGRLDYSWPVQVNRLVVEGGFDLVLSIGQVVPHEVAGMAGYTKNILVGLGGAECINRSHFLGAVYGMERLMGRRDNPVREVFDEGRTILGDIPIVYALTVVAGNAVQGLYIGDDRECYERAAEASARVNIVRVDRPVRTAVVFLDPGEYRSTWLGNKAIYRMRMAMADGGRLIVLAPGVREFGEDSTIDGLIRKYGYRGRDTVLAAVRDNDDLGGSLSAAAHLIHGSTEGRFSVTYCPGSLTREEIEGVGFAYGDIREMTRRYDPGGLKEGFNALAGGEEVFFVSNPGQYLWVHELPSAS